MPTRRTLRRTEVDAHRRRLSVEKMMSRGISNASEMAAHCGVSIRTILNDIDWIKENWLNNTRDDVQMKAAKRVHQLEALLASCLNSYDISRAPVETVKTVKIKCDNQECNQGIVLKDGKNVACPRCNGKLEVFIEQRSIEGQPGDASFLNVARAIIVDCARIEGVLSKDAGVASTLKKTATRSKLPDGTIIEKLEEFYSTATYETIIETKAALDNVKAKIAMKELNGLDEADVDNCDVDGV